RHFRPGTQRLPCPECARVKHRPRDTALALTIETDGAVWHCFRCGFKGGTRDQWANDYAIERARIDGERFAKRERERLARARASPSRDKQTRRWDSVAERAREVWASGQAAPPNHPYLVAKRLQPNGLRIVERLDYSRHGTLEHALLVPMRDASGAICNLQGID